MTDDTNSAKNARVEEAFTQIYRDHLWGTATGSGEGANPQRNHAYIQMLQGFMRAQGVKSVVDVGCGDWQFSQQIDWSDIDYTGIDVVPTVIEKLNSKYGRPGVRFIHEDAIHGDLPKADLLIAKDVLQHLPDEMVLQFLARLRQFKYAILTNDRRQYRHPSWRNLWNLRPDDITRPNCEISAGEYRPLRLREVPFNLKARELLRIEMWHSNGMHLKEVLLWENTPASTR